MKLKYERPVMYCEEFAPNTCIAACGDTVETKEFTCFRGPNNDEAQVFNTGVCNQVPVYYPGVTTVTSSYKTETFSGASGVYAYCTLVNGSGYFPDEWVQSGSTLAHKTTTSSGGGKKPSGSTTRDTHDNNYHCMAVAVYGDVEEFRNS